MCEWMFKPIGRGLIDVYWEMKAEIVSGHCCGVRLNGEELARCDYLVLMIQTNWPMH